MLDARRETAEHATTQVFAVTQPSGLRVYQRIETERQPEVGHGDARPREVERSDPDDREEGTVQPNALPQHRRIARKSSLPIVLADQHRRRRGQLGRTHRIERAATRGLDAQHREVILRNDEGAGDLPVGRGRLQQSKPANQRSVLGAPPRDGAAGVGERQFFDRKRDDAAERSQTVPVGFVVRIAESRVGRAGLEAQ